MAEAASNTDYLLEYSESIASLPAELKKNLALLGELDAKLKGAVQGTKASPPRVLSRCAASVSNPLRCRHRADSFEDIEQRTTTKALRRSKGTRTAESQRVQWEQTRKQRQECIDISDEKVALAEQTYELVDSHVRRLDETLQQFEAELRQTDPSRLADLKLAAVQADPFAAAGIGQGSRKRGARDLQYSDMPIDDNEPRYCTCQQVSFGEMVACDNDDVRHPNRYPYRSLLATQEHLARLLPKRDQPGFGRLIKLWCGVVRSVLTSGFIMHAWG
jgi:hypothetical protein